MRRDSHIGCFQGIHEPCARESQRLALAHGFFYRGDTVCVSGLSAQKSKPKNMR